MRAHLAIRMAPLALAAGLLGGCISFGPKIPDTLFDLTAVRSAPAGSSASGQLSDAIVVLEPETDKKLAVQRIPVQVDASNVAYLKKAMWVERPAKLFRGLLAETLRAKGGRIVFEGIDTEASGSMRLYGRLLDMGYDAPSQSVVVRFDAVRERPGGAVMTRRFESIVPGISSDPTAVGPALNRAANDVAGQVADWAS